jgi:DNA-binding response OmpR family regulator
MRILVVDDEPPIVQLCVKILARAGHEVDGVTSGEDALARLTSTPVDLLVVDYNMPELNGIEVIRRARTLQPGLKVVMITAHRTREAAEEELGAGPSWVLMKPFTPNELVQTVDATLNQSRDRS